MGKGHAVRRQDENCRLGTSVVSILQEFVRRSAFVEIAEIALVSTPVAQVSKSSKAVLGLQFLLSDMFEGSDRKRLVSVNHSLRQLHRDLPDD
jgi:hypothetical protein